MTLDMNNAGEQKTSELIPDGTFAKVAMTIRHGGIDGDGDVDRNLLRASKDPTSDVRMLDCEFTVLDGPHVRRKFWQLFTVQGGKVDEDGVSIGWKISKSTFRAMIDSALGLDPKDMSDAAKQKRILRGLADLSGISFVAKIRVEPNEDPRYADQNRLDRVVLPTEREWKLVMEGQDVPASPSRSRSNAKKAPVQPAWSQAPAHAAQPAQASPQPHPQSPPPATAPAPAWAQPSATPTATAKQPGPAWLNG